MIKFNKILLLVAGAIAILVSPAQAKPVETSEVETSETLNILLVNNLALINQSKCSNFLTLKNTIKPIASNDEKTSANLPEDQSVTSTCAADLDSVSANPETLSLQETASENESVNTSPEQLKILPIEEDRERWRFIFQPYATIPISIAVAKSIRT